jgi:hypothetical protein
MAHGEPVRASSDADLWPCLRRDVRRTSVEPNVLVGGADYRLRPNEVTMLSRKRIRRPAEGWPKGWYYSGEFDTVNIEALLAPDEFFNRVILERKPNDRCSEPMAAPGADAVQRRPRR